MVTEIYDLSQLWLHQTFKMVVNLCFRTNYMYLINVFKQNNQFYILETDEPIVTYHSKCPKTLRPRAQDAYLLFQV